MLSSFLPKGGQIVSVAVYPSEFGLKRMEEEELHGPIGLFDDENERSDDDGDNEIDEEKLRAYEKSHLRCLNLFKFSDCTFSIVGILHSLEYLTSPSSE